MPIQSYAADDHWGFVLTNGELWTNSASNTFPLPCTSGPPTKVVGITDATRVWTGKGFACAVRATGAVACWDWSTWSAPQTVVGISDAVDVVADGGIGCVKRTSGVVQCWSSVAQPVDVSELVAPSQFFSNSGNAMCALRPDGILGCSVNLAPFRPVTKGTRPHRSVVPSFVF